MNQLEQFASRGLKAQNAVDEIIASHGQDARATKKSPADPTKAAGAERSSGADGLIARPRSSLEREWAKGRGLMAAGVTVQQVHWSNDQAWLQRVMVDRDQPATVRAAAQKRLRKLGRNKPKL